MRVKLTFTNDFDDSRPCRTEHGVVTSNDDNNNTHCWQKFVYKQKMSREQHDVATERSAAVWYTRLFD